MNSTITIDERREQPHHVEEMVRVVEQLMPSAAGEAVTIDWMVRYEF